MNARNNQTEILELHTVIIKHSIDGLKSIKKGTGGRIPELENGVIESIQSEQ